MLSDAAAAAGTQSKVHPLYDSRRRKRDSRDMEDKKRKEEKETSPISKWRPLMQLHQIDNVLLGTGTVLSTTASSERYMATAMHIPPAKLPPRSTATSS